MSNFIVLFLFVGKKKYFLTQKNIIGTILIFKLKLYLSHRSHPNTAQYTV